MLEGRVSDIHRVGIFIYSADVGAKVFSAKLAEQGLDVVHEKLLIKRGVLQLAVPITFYPLLMAPHEPFVFFGLRDFCESSIHFPYGRPWAYKAAISASAGGLQRRTAD